MMNEKNGPAPDGGGAGPEDRRTDYTGPAVAIQAVLSQLECVKRNGDGWTARCPAHDDKNPSLSVSIGRTGNVLMYCYAGCSTESVVQALGLSMRDLAPPGDKRMAQRTVRGVYESYITAANAIKRAHCELRDAIVEHYAYSATFRVMRFNPPDGNKTFRPIHRTSRGWTFGNPPGKLPLYHTTDVADADVVYAVEGEKACDVARSIGLAAVTSAHGSKSAARSDWAPLAGKTVTILPDNDAAGMRYATDVARILHGLECTVRIVELPNLPPGGDIDDLVKNCSENQDPSDLAHDIAELAERTALWTPEAVAPGDTELAPIPWRPFPVELLPEVLRNFVVETSSAIGCDPVMVALPALATLAAAIGTTRRIQLKASWTEPAILWCAIVARSGTLKSPAHEAALRPLTRLQAERFKEHERELKKHYALELKHKNEKKQWAKNNPDATPPEAPERPEAVRYMVSDATVESLAPILQANSRGVLLSRDELSGWLGGFNQYKNGKGSDVPNWLELHRAGTVIVDRKTGPIRTLHVPHAAVSVTGTIQPGTLDRVLTREFFECGLAARLLLAMPPQRRKKWSDADVSPITVGLFADLVNKLVALEHTQVADGECVPVNLPMTPAAKAAWTKWYDIHADAEAQAGSDDLASVFSKLEGYAARFALVFHCVQSVTEQGFPSGSIDISQIKRGTALSDWFANEAERLYGLFDESDDQRERRKVIEKIRKLGGVVSVRDMMRSPAPKIETAEAAELALKELVKAGIGYWEMTPPGSKGGRAVNQFHLLGQRDTRRNSKNTGENRGCVPVSQCPRDSESKIDAAPTDSPPDTDPNGWGIE